MLNKNDEIPMVSFSNYKVDASQGVTRRVADFLNWYAEIAPDRWVKFPDLVKIVMMENRKHHENSDIVTRFKKLIHKARILSVKDYGRGIIFVSGKGVRASTTPDDLTVNVLAPSVRQLGLRAKRTEEISKLIKPNQIVNKELRDWARKTKAEIDQLSCAIPKLLLPPKPSPNENQNENENPKNPKPKS